MTTVTQDMAERERQTIQAILDAKKSAAERNRLGQFATPNALALEIARFVEPLLMDKGNGIRFADPSIGTGSFFSAALAVFGAGRIESAVGVEIDHDFAAAARHLWSGPGLKVVEDDFTRVVRNDPLLPVPNLILANPPYVRHHHIDRQQKQRLQAIAAQMTGVEVNGLAGLYVYFLLLATAWMQQDGVAAWLVPSEFMDVNYGASLKRYLTDELTLVRLHRFDPSDLQFGDALVSSVVLIFRKCQPPEGHVAEFSYGGTLELPHAIDRLPLDRLRTSRKWTVFPNHAKNDRLTISAGAGPTLGDFFRIQRGIATGGNGFFILDRTDAAGRDLPTEYLRPILPSPRHLKATVIETDAEGYPLVDRQLCLIDCDLPEHVVKRQYPALWAYLNGPEAAGVREGYLTGKRVPWYKQERREPAPLLCTYMGRGSDDKQPFRFIRNRSQAVATNLYLMLYPRGEMSAMLRRHPDRLATVHGILNQITGAELRGEGRVYGGGLNKIEPSELGRIDARAIISHWPELSRERDVLQRGLFDAWAETAP